MSSRPSTGQDTASGKVLGKLGTLRLGSWQVQERERRRSDCHYARSVDGCWHGGRKARVWDGGVRRAQLVVAQLGDRQSAQRRVVEAQRLERRHGRKQWSQQQDWRCGCSEWAAQSEVMMTESQSALHATAGETSPR
jgi:hypothetical protein